MLINAASFRDPSGFVFRDPDGTLLRQVNKAYTDNYRKLIDSGLYQQLVDAGWLVEHQEVSLSKAVTDQAYCVLQPREIGFISYPYEWAFSALKDAALLTLDIQRRAMQQGMSLKDASGFNVQFEGTKPIFIDTLSFEKHEPGRPWQAYSQFCRHFLAPLALMAKRDIALNRLLTIHLDGIPLDLASPLLPRRTYLQPGLLFHLHLQARMVRKYSDTSKPTGDNTAKKQRASQSGLQAMLDHLRKTIARMSVKASGTEWADYYQDNSYSDHSFQQKKKAVEDYLRRAQPQTVWDLGANTGEFSRIAIKLGATAYAFDYDPACVELNYQACHSQKQQRMLPLCLDLSNPTPAIGWAHTERLSLAERGPADTVMALALIHHLAISNNLPFTHIANYFAQLCNHLIIEFVPKGDPQVQRLLRSREDIFDNYDQSTFEAVFAERFELCESQPIGDDGRVLYLMKTINPRTD